MHQSEAEEQAERVRLVQKMRAVNAALVWGIERADRHYTAQELADFLTGAVAMAALFDEVPSPDALTSDERGTDHELTAVT